jgi:hypothetical protein
MHKLVENNIYVRIIFPLVVLLYLSIYSKLYIDSLEIIYAIL